MIEDGVLDGTLTFRSQYVDFIRIVDNGGTLNLRGNRRPPPGTAIGQPVVVQLHGGSWAAKGSVYADLHLS